MSHLWGKSLIAQHLHIKIVVIDHCHDKHFILVYPREEAVGNPKLVLLVKTMSQSCFLLISSEYFKHVHIQFYTPMSTSRGNYIWWDTKSIF